MPCSFKNQCPWFRWCRWQKFSPDPRPYKRKVKKPPQCIHYKAMQQRKARKRRRKRPGNL